METLDWFKNHWIWTSHKPIYNANGSTVFYIRAPHHYLLGIAIIIMGWLSAPYYPTTTAWCYIVGSLIFLDDAVEHTLTTKTPLRMLFNWLRKKGWSYLR